MKKMILLFAVLLTISMQNNLRAQDFDVVNFTILLDDVFDITVTAGNSQIATFATAADYNDGVFEGAGIASGVSVVKMEATGNWNTTINANANFTDGTQNIPAENLGVWVEATGAHTYLTGEVDYACVDIASTQIITLGLEPFIVLGANPAGNGGDVSDNEFTLHWRMGTPEVVVANGLGTMFDQMANADFGPGTYLGVITITMTPAP